MIETKEGYISPQEIESWENHYKLGNHFKANVLTLMSFNKKIDIQCLELAYKHLLEKHDILRSSFIMINNNLKHLISNYNEENFKIKIIAGNKNSVDKILNHEKGKIKNIENTPLIKGYIFTDSKIPYLFVILIHHIICDFWSLHHLIKKDLNYYYSCYKLSNVCEKNTISISCYDQIYKKWSVINSNSNEYWIKILKDYNWKLNKSAFYEQYIKSNNYVQSIINVYKVIITSFFRKKLSGRRYTIFVRNDYLQKIKKLSETHNCSIFNILLVIYTILLYKITKNEVIFIRFLVTLRFTEELKKFVGNFIGENYLFHKINHSTIITDLIKMNQNLVLKSYKKTVLYEDKLKLINIKKQSPLWINFIDKNQTGNKSHNITSTEYGKIPIESPLCCGIIEYTNGLLIDWEYNLNIFSINMIKYIIKEFLFLIEHISENVDKNIHEITSIKYHCLCNHSCIQF